jgi:SAM-dependent methyltransferase
MKHLPVGLQSLIIQCTALLLAGLAVRLLHSQFTSLSPLWQLVLAQGALACVLSLAWRQPAWWPPLHAAFLPSVLLTLQWNAPPWVYLAVFLLLLLFFWGTARTRVPLYLSDRKAWQAIAAWLPEQQAFSFIDLGSGFGGVLFDLKKRFPQGRFVGTELAPAPWLISRVRAWIQGSRVQLMRRDYTALNLADFDVVFAFLSPAAMPGLWQQAQAQMLGGSLFISLSFNVEGREPDHVAMLGEHARQRLYAWRM